MPHQKISLKFQVSISISWLPYKYSLILSHQYFVGQNTWLLSHSATFTKKLRLKPAFLIATAHTSQCACVWQPAHATRPPLQANYKPTKNWNEHWHIQTVNLCNHISVAAFLSPSSLSFYFRARVSWPIGPRLPILNFKDMQRFGLTEIWSRFIIASSRVELI